MQQANASMAVQKHIEPGLTMFSASELHVVRSYQYSGHDSHRSGGLLIGWLITAHSTGNSASSTASSCYEGVLDGATLTGALLRLLQQ